MLSVAGRVYGVIADLRNRLYENETFRSRGLGAKTISVGNITAGGTGKTPLVASIAQTLIERGETVCILTRGYGRKDPRSRVVVADGEKVLAGAEKAGDEPAELAAKLGGKAVIIADPDRVSAGLWAKDEFGITVFILDDGFQHRRILRDLDIVCIDATDPFGGEKMLPTGRLREPQHNLARADVAVITRVDLAGDMSKLTARISTLNPDARIFSAFNKIANITELREFLADSQRPQGSIADNLVKHGDPAVAANDAKAEIRALAFCGLGNPKNFFNLLLSLDDPAVDLDLAVIKDFPDHHAYTQSDISELEMMATAAGVSILLTTAKDAVKLNGLKFALPCYVVEIEVCLNDDDAFRSLL